MPQLPHSAPPPPIRSRHAQDQIHTRFISSDSIDPLLSTSQSLNRFAYAYNSPYSYIDDDGHIPVIVVVAVLVGMAMTWESDHNANIAVVAGPAMEVAAVPTAFVLTTTSMAQNTKGIVELGQGIHAEATGESGDDYFEAARGSFTGGLLSAAGARASLERAAVQTEAPPPSMVQRGLTPFTKQQTDGLKKLFGVGSDGAKDLIARINRLKPGQRIPLPKGVDKNVLKAYRVAGQKIVDKGVDATSIQALRNAAIDSILDGL